MLKTLLVVSALLGMCVSLAPNVNRPLPPPQRAPPQNQGDAAAIMPRRSILALPFLSVAILPSDSSALDMDAFMNQELSKEECDPRTSKKCVQKLTDDEALCKFGQPSKERGDACVRAGQSTKLTKNGVDAYGKVDRGDFTRCKQFYDLENGKYVKKTECGLSPS